MTRLSCEHSIPPAEAIKRGLTIEASDHLDEQHLPAASAALATSAHAPFDFAAVAGRSGRLNIAALDSDWRRESLACLEDYIVQAARLPRVRKVVMHAAPRLWPADGQLPKSPADVKLTTVSEYGYLVDSIRRLAATAAKLNLQIVVENNRAYWLTVPPGTPFEQVDRSAVPDYFATTPWEWLGLWRDVRRDNVKLCLDTCHAATVTQRVAPADRPAMMFAYLAEPRAIGHVHWNDNTLADERGRADQHWALGPDGLGDDFHRAIRNLPDATLLLEHWFDLETLDRELAYIAAL
jgi:sugar phosphate isomerase/epimerase